MWVPPSPSLVTLPAPPPEKVGWPWTEEPASRCEKLPSGKAWPRISVVTPSFNQGRFLEQTIRSVLLQGYPNLEYIIIDGGSTDESVDIIKKYEKHLAYWTSEPDDGQSQAINKGFNKTTGQIMCWLNSDDYYAPETLKIVAETLGDDTGEFAMVGHCVQVFTDGRPPYHGEGRYEGLTRLLQYWKGYQMHQPSIFWRREVFEKVGFLAEDQHYIMDFDYWIRIARLFTFKNVNQVLSYAVYHDEAKTGDNFSKYTQALKEETPKYWPSPLSADYWCLRLSRIKYQYYVPLARRLKNSATYQAGRVMKGTRTR